MRVVFMGTPEFSVQTLEALLEKHNVVGVFTQPDKPSGRGKKLTAPPVKQVATHHGLKIYQPDRIKTDSWVEVLKDLSPDVIVVVAYGQILSKEILEIPRLGCVNVHASLLPKYRGAAPINWAIVNGETESGVTTMQMDEGLDTGDMLLKESVPITAEMNAQMLHDALATLGAKLLIKTLDQFEKNGITPTPQDSDLSSYAPMLSKDVSKLDWTETAKQIVDKVRGFDPWPVAHTTWQGKMLKIFKASVSECLDENLLPGRVVDLTKEAIVVSAGHSAVAVKEIQWGSGKRMPVEAFLLGHDVKLGDVFGDKEA